MDWDGRTDTAAYAALSERMHFLIGTSAQIAERLIAWQREYGFDEIICQIYAAGMCHEDSLRAIELLGRTVLPQLLSGEPAGTRPIVRSENRHR